MRVYEVRNNIGQLRSFEVNNILLGRNGVVRVLRRVPGVLIKRRPKRLLSWFRESDFCAFEIDGVTFTVEEPFSDNSRYWIGSQRYSEELEKVLEAFKNQKLPLGL